jgi:glycerol dehydrogenase
MITTTQFPSRYVQGSGALHRLSEELSGFGKLAFVLCDPNFMDRFKSKYHAEISKKVELRVEKFGGTCTEEELKRVTGLAKGCDVLVSMGGGRVIDTGRIVAFRLGVSEVVIPTIASTDAPCSSVAPIRDDAGQIKEVVATKKNPELVLVDTEVIAESPVRYLISGMGDTLATWFEAESCRVTGSPSGITGDCASLTTSMIARLCYDTILEYGLFAKQACEAKVVTPALEHVVEANSLLSSVGFESGGLGAAHGIENGLGSVKEAEEYLHGELVAVGVLASLFLTDKSSDLIDEVYCFCESVGLPTTLSEIGLGKISDSQLIGIAEVASQVDFMNNEACPVTKETVYAALKAADAEGRRRKSQ